MRGFPLPTLLAALLAGGCAGSRPLPPESAPYRPLAGDGGRSAKGPDGAPAARFAGRVTWPDLLDAVLERSPSVRAARATWEAALERAPQVRSLPDPMVQFRQFRSDLGASASRVRLETMVTQEIPFPTVLLLRGDAAEKEAAMAGIRCEMALRDAAVEAREAFLELAYLDRARETVAANRGILARYAEFAAGDLAAGRTKLSEEFRAQSLLAQAGYDLVVLDDLRRAAEQRVRSAAALPTDAPLGPAVPDAPGPLSRSYEDLLRLAEAGSREIAMADAALEAAGIEERMARWEFAPTFTVGGEWMRNDMQDPAMGTFRNARTAIVGLSVPLWFPAKTARVREMSARVGAAAAARAAEIERVRAGVADLYARVRNAERLVTLYDATLLPQAERSARLAEVLYREGKAGLSGMLEVARAVQEFRLARARAETERGKALARLEQAVGAPVAGPPAETGSPGGGIAGEAPPTPGPDTSVRREAWTSRIAARDDLSGLLPVGTPETDSLLAAAASDEGTEKALAAGPLDLETVRTLAAVRAPGARAAREGWRASVEQIDQAAWLEDLLSAIGPLARAAAVPPAEKAGTGGMQVPGGMPGPAMASAFPPWPSNVALRGEMAEAEIAMAREMARAAAAEALAAAEEAWFEQWHAEESLRLKGGFLETLERMADVSARRYAAGRGMQEEALRIEVEIANRRADLARHRAERAAAVVRLNGLLARPAEAPLPEAAPPRLPESIPPSGRATTEARERSPMARRAGFAADEARVALRMAETMQAAPMEGAPVAFGAEAAYLQELRRRVPAADEEREAARRGAESMAVEAWTRLDTALREARVQERTAIPLARQAFEVSERSYESGSITLAEHLQTWWMAVEARHEAVEARMRAGFARAALLRAAGAETTERPR